ncbi:hypothetical protein Patl1_13592 [Pistacia atlantica]|uniref:Uncharacterized protein n=1 Tax=Pistacia atlantica TaxID=434234 RepID=A0ACC1AYN8_9ROSI|nr:hypothetical protein Patl1_13592 [Pistacia atlantica]
MHNLILRNQLVLDSSSQRIGKVNKAFEIFCNMESFGCSPDVVTYNTLINGFCRVNEVDRGHWLLKEVKLRDEISPNAVTYTSVILGYCKLGKMEEASCIRDEMSNSGIQPTAVTFNILIDGFGKVGDMISAESMRERMLSLGYVPDVVTFTSLIDGYFRNGQAGMPNEAFCIMQLASEDLNLAFPSLKKPMPLASTDIPVAP